MLFALCGAVGALHTGAQPNPPASLTSLVDPFIGTGAHGHTHPAATLPFGMVQLGPDTRLGGWDGSSGYHHSDSRIFGFSHTHLSGTGVPDYGDVLVMPLADTVRTHNGADGRPGYASAFSHQRERAGPGYYAVTLDDSGVRAELTATLRTGFHRYTFPREADAHVVVDLEHRDEVLDSFLRLTGNRSAVGLRRSTGWAADQRVYFALEFSRAFSAAQIVVDDKAVAGPTEGRGRRVKAVFSFGRLDAPLLVKVGLSAVSAEGARRNLEAENPAWSFDAVRAAADATWERELEKIRVTGGSAAQRRIFYTALYHALLTPNVFMDVDGTYLGRDLQPHRADGFTYYSVFSLWDTFRALHPLLTIIDRARTIDFVRTCLRQFEDAGRLPVWELAANETDTMIGYHAVPVIADAWLKGIDGFDHALAWKAMIASADQERADLAAYRRQGFLPAEDGSESVSKTLEYAYDDWTIAQVARRLGKPDEYARFMRRAQAWKHVFDPATGFMRARVDGFWFAPFDAAEVNVHYTEANAWQYSLFVPHDVDGLMRALGGPEALVARLDALFSADSRTTGRDQADITGLIGQYAHGNEPSHHMAYLYAFAGQTWKTQDLVRRIMDTLYADAPDGLSGNEDCGQLSAWFVLSALGFYPVAPGSNEYVIGSPLFAEATIALENGRTFAIRAPATSAVNRYVQRATLNGRSWTRSALPHDAVAEGGVLVFDMGPTPNREWGAKPGDRPRTSIEEHLVAAAPFASEGRSVFRSATRVSFGHGDPRAQIRVAADGRAVSAASPPRRGPVVVDATTSFVAVAHVPGMEPSPSVTFRLWAVPAHLRVRASQPWAPQYNAGGEDALIDGRRGGSDFRLGRWQGFRVQDLDLDVDLGATRDVSRVAVGFLQDQRAWILMPRRIDIAISEDGATWTDVGRDESRVSEREPSVVTKDLGVTFAARRARWVRVRVAGFGALPAWHPGAGEVAWIFADEVVVDSVSLPNQAAPVARKGAR